MQEFQLVEYSDQRILTTQQLANGYGATTQKITNNFNNNKKHYVEGKHFYRLEGEEKHNFLNLTKIEDGSKNAKSLYLWTERGALLHAKSLNTDKAWQVYEHLVDTYFRARSQLQQPQIQTLPTDGQGIQTLLSQLGWLINLMEQQFQQPTPVMIEDRQRISALDEAKNFLTEILADGKKPSKEIHAAAKERGISESTLSRAKDALNIDCKDRKGFGGDTVVYWQMPQYDMTVLKEKKLLTKQEACFYIGISLQTLNRLINKTDFLAVVRIGFGQGKVFINREKLDQWISEQDGSMKSVR